MPSTRVRLRFSVLALCLVAAAGCDCGEPEPLKPLCKSDSDCAEEPEASYCEVRTGKCVPDDRQCDPAGGEWQCCPGQYCKPTLQICMDKYDTCDTANPQCRYKGQVCKEMADKQRGAGCTFDQCDNGACKEGLSCFNGYCVGEPPCGGGCAQGNVCVTQSNRCFNVGDGTTPESQVFPGTCRQSCPAGNILVLKDPKNVFNRCDRGQIDCECKAMPPLVTHDMARFSSLAAVGDKLLMSAYDGDHGDLVVHTWDKAALKITKTEWVDGVPSGGAIVGDPAGPRGGRSEPGPDVGRHTSLAHDGANGITHVAYYAVKDGQTVLGDLRYASRSGDGAWALHTVDGRSDLGAGAENADAGLYAKLALAPDGNPVIAYFVRGAGTNQLGTRVKVARAKVRQPTKADDWVRTTVDSGSKPPPPCVPPCNADNNEVCTKATAGPGGLCLQKAASNASCNPRCASGDVCVVVTGNSVCRTSLGVSELAGLPEGNGLHPAIAYVDSKPVVVWYDQTAKVLKGAIASADSASAGATFPAANVKVLDNGKPSPTATTANDVGMFASIAVAPASVQQRIAIAYMDQTARQLRVLTTKGDFTQPNKILVDDGTGDPATDPILFVGADTSIRFDASSGLVVVYQDSTGNNLRMARQAPGASFVLSTLATQGAGGFYANVAADGATLYASHAILKAASASVSGNKPEVLKIAP